MIELDDMLKIPGGMVRLEGLEDALTPESEGWVMVNPPNTA